MKKSTQAIPNLLLKRECELRGWSQQYIAEQIGASHYYISRWERGTASPSPYYRQKLCALFGRNARELGLLPEEDKESIGLPQEGQSGIFAPSETRVHDPAIPRLLPEQAKLVGCGEMLARLKNQLCKTQRLSSIVLSGIPGVGKTTLAVALAYDDDLLNYFHDGILWAGLGPRPNLLGLLSRWGTLLGVASSEGRKLTTIDDWTRSVRAIIGERRILARDRRRLGNRERSGLESRWSEHGLYPYHAFSTNRTAICSGWIYDVAAVGSETKAPAGRRRIKMTRLLKAHFTFPVLSVAAPIGAVTRTDKTPSRKTD